MLFLRSRIRKKRKDLPDKITNASPVGARGGYEERR